MHRVNKYYHICDKGHLTVSDSPIKKKCGTEIQEVRLVKSGRAGVAKEILGKHPCEEAIKETREIPEELTFDRIWDLSELRAFMHDQTPENLRINFILALQKAFEHLKSRIDDAHEGFNELIRMGK